MTTNVPPPPLFMRHTPDGPRWLYAEPGRLRVPFRLAVFAVAFVLLQGIVDTIVAPLFALVSAQVGEPVPAYPWTMLASVLGATAVALRFVDAGEWSHIGLAGDAWRPRALAAGTLAGSAALGLTALILFVCGLLAFTRVANVDVMAAIGVGGAVGSAVNGLPGSSAGAAAGAADWSASALRLMLQLAPWALWEELVFRGYLWTVAEDASSPRVALVSTSVAFGLVHITNPGANVRTIAMVMLAGACLGALRLITNSLAAAWLAHLAWNWCMAALLHVPVSGMYTPAPLYRGDVHGPPWLTGGAWGPEGGLIAGGVFLGALALARRSRAFITLSHQTRLTS